MMTQQKALKNSNQAWAVKPLRLAACILSVSALSSPSFAADISKQRLVYEVYAGGIHAVQATLNIDLKNNNQYALQLEAKTRGFLGKVAPWQGTFESRGWMLNDGNRNPEQHKSTANWRGETEVKDYKYAKDGTFQNLIVTEHNQQPVTKTIDASITKNTTDALTATLKVLENFNQEGKCEGSSLVFDGKRSFEQSFTHVQTTKLEASKYNIYGGNAAECLVEVTPKEGKWYEKPRGWLSIQEQGREKGLMPTIWIAQISEDAPAVPVKIRVKTDYGMLFMHLAEYQKGETKLVAQKRILDE